MVGNSLSLQNSLTQTGVDLLILTVTLQFALVFGYADFSHCNIKPFKDHKRVVVELKTRQNVDLLEIINSNVIILDVLFQYCIPLLVCSLR